MSASSSPPPSIFYDSFELAPAPLQPTPDSSLQNSTSVTRTLAIIKTHALSYRFDIERRIQEASFEVRQNCLLNMHLTKSYYLVRLWKRDKWNSIHRLTRKLYMNCLGKTQLRWLSEFAFIFFLLEVNFSLLSRTWRLLFRTCQIEVLSGFTFLNGAAR